MFRVYFVKPLRDEESIYSAVADGFERDSSSGMVVLLDVSLYETKHRNDSIKISGSLNVYIPDHNIAAIEHWVHEGGD